MTRNTLAIFALLALSTTACKDKDDDTGAPADTDTDTDTDSDSDSDSDTDTDSDSDTDSDTDTDLSFTIAGTTLDLAMGTPGTEGLCVAAINPDGAVTGGGTVTMATSTLGADGSFAIAGVDTKPAFGILVSVFDCDTAGTTVLTSATPIETSSYADVETGDTLTTMAFIVNATYRDGIDASLAAAGYSGDVTTDGALIGMVVDGTLAPIDDAVVTGADTVYYQDSTSADGLFTTAGAMNTATDAAAGSMWVIPAAGISTYSATASGYTFAAHLAGSSEGSAMILPLLGTAE